MIKRIDMMTRLFNVGSITHMYCWYTDVVSITKTRNQIGNDLILCASYDFCTLLLTLATTIAFRYQDRFTN